MQQQNKIREEYLQNGFFVLRSFFNKNKIKELRKDLIVLSKIDKEILLHKKVQELLINKELIEKIKIILDTKKLIYYSDSAIVNHSEPLKSKNGFHNDARYEDEDIPYSEEYPILRVGIYFEDFKNYSGGLKIKEKSHKYYCFNFRAFKQNLKNVIKIIFTKTRYRLNSLKLGKSINLDLEEGDIAIWNLRTHHCGVSRRLKYFKNLCLQPHFEKLLPKFLFLPTQYSRNRCAIFCTFAKNDLLNANIYNYVKNKIDYKKINEIEQNPKLKDKIKNLDIAIPNFSKIT